jgi:NAD-dependent deacetylase
MTEDGLIREAALRLKGACRLVVLTGSGVSKESGIPTFRDAQDGLWARYDPTDLATREGFLRDPAMVWEWYSYRFGMVESARPNPGHLAIAEMEGIFPQVTVVTQNIDGLHQTAGSTDVVELHGSIRRYKCLDGRHTGFTRADLALQTRVPPVCPYCGALLRPDVVWFGELLPADALHRAFDLSRGCDAMLVVGTSGEVEPAASLPVYAASSGALVVDVNPDRGRNARWADIFLQGSSGEILPRLVEALRIEEPISPNPGLGSSGSAGDSVESKEFSCLTRF